MNTHILDPFERQVFQETKSQFAGKDVIISPAFLRQQKALTSNQSSYKFKFLAENAAPTLPERYLSRTDSFRAIRMGLFLITVATAGQEGAAVLQTYPNAAVFSTANNAAHLETVYNGLVRAKVENTIVIDGFPTNNFRHVGTTLQASGSFAQSERPQLAGMRTLPVILTLDGAKTNEIEIEIPNWSGIVMAPSSGTNYLVCVLEGFQINGASNLDRQ